MRYSIVLSLFFVALITFVSKPSQAEYFVWEDQVSEVSLSYPDLWQSIHLQKPDEVLNLVAPGEGHYAGCRVRVRDDGRFKIHPRYLAGSIQRLNVSRDFWEEYVHQYDNATLISVTDNAGLGPGFASFAEMAYISEVGPRVKKRGFAFATIHYDMLYVFECSSEISSFNQWREGFLSILKSVDIDLKFSPYLNGHYRNFPADGDIVIKGIKETDTYIY